MTQPRPRPPLAGRITDRLLPHFAKVRAYASVSPPEALSAESGRSPAEIVKLDANENPYGPIPRVREVIASFASTEGSAIYPDPDQTLLRRALADYTGVSAERVVAAAGSDELIDLLARLFVAPGDSVVTATPTFGMYAFTTEVVGGRLATVPRNAEDFSIDVEALARAARSAKLVFLASPNNPTGNSVSLKDLRPLLETGVPVAVDEAYYEFSDQPSAVALLDDYPNLFVLRTFSKWAGLAGLRVGYGLFPPDLAAVLMKVKPPYNVGTLAQAAAIAALDGREEALARVRAIIHDRDSLARGLSALPGVHIYPSDANFLLARFPGRNTVALHKRMRARGISLRRFETPGLEDCIRISVGTPEDHEMLLAALREELESA
jgi:histidinol-phosphate aminotransferase